MKIAVKGITFSYDGAKALDDVTLKVERPEVVGIVGPNGSGKSTLLKCINRKLHPRIGSVLLNDADLRALSRKEIARKLGVVPQMSGITFPFSVADVVMMGRVPYLGRFAPLRKEDIDAAGQAMRFVNIERLASRAITEISGGEYQRVIIARALAQEPEALLLDEPTLHLDLNHQLELLDLLKNLVAEKRLIVLITTHDLNLALRYSSRLLLLDSGKIYAQGSPAEVLTRDNIRTVYRIEAKIIEAAGVTSVIPLSPLPRPERNQR